MNFGYNYNQALLSGVAPPPAPYTPSYSVPVQSQPGGPAPLPQPMRTDSFESTRDKSVGDVIGGFFTGAGKAIYDMGHGLFFLGKTAGYAVSHPIKSMGYVGGAVVNGVTHPVRTAETVVTLPFTIAKGIVKPYSQALQQGHYGEALGRFAVDFTVIASSLGGGKKPPAAAEPTPAPPPPPPPAGNVADDVGNVADDIGNAVNHTGTPGVGGAINNNLSGDVGDTVLEEIGKVGNVTGNGNHITVNIGNITVGGAQMSGNTMSTVGGGAASAAQSAGTVADGLNNAAKVVDNASKVADKVDDVANAASNMAGASAQTAETASQTAGAYASAATAATGSTIGMKIGSGIDAVIAAPGKMVEVVGNGIQSVGRGIQNVGNAVLHPLETLRNFNPNPEAFANGIRAAGNALADGVIYASKNPMQTVIIAGAVGRGGAAVEDILQEMDIVR